jgi:hypothetical protein
MRLPDIYREWCVILGVALILLGAGNWLVGRLKTEQYGKMIASQPDIAADQAYRSFEELDSGANAVLEPFTAEQRRVSHAAARMDFYHATFLTGYALVITGLLFTFVGFLAVIRRDARRASRGALRETIAPGDSRRGQHPPPW